MSSPRRVAATKRASWRSCSSSVMTGQASPDSFIAWKQTSSTPTANSTFSIGTPSRGSTRIEPSMFGCMRKISSARRSFCARSIA